MKMKTLVVDDQEGIRDLLGSLLKVMNGHDVVKASNAKEAIQLMRTEKFDLVITDNDMDKRNDGLLVIETAHSLSSQPQVIWMSGRATCDPELADTARRLGACDILAKPFHPKELHEMIIRVEMNQKLETTAKT